MAGALAFGCSELLELPQGYWSVLTAIIVMQTSVGASLESAANRLVGTFAGAALGFAFVSATPSTALGTLLALVISTGVLAMLAVRYPSLRIAPMTAAIVLVSSPSHATAWISAFHRVTEITLGCFIGILVAMFVAPARAASKLRAETKKALSLLASLVSLQKQTENGKGNEDEIETIDEEIYAAYSRMGALIKEVQTERASSLSHDRLDPTLLLKNMRALRAAIYILCHITRMSWPPLSDTLTSEMVSTNEVTSAYLLALGSTVVASTQPPPLNDLELQYAAFNSNASRDKAERSAGPATAFVSAYAQALDEVHRALADLYKCLADGTTATDESHALA